MSLSFENETAGSGVAASRRRISGWVRVQFYSWLSSRRPEKQAGSGSDSVRLDSDLSRLEDTLGQPDELGCNEFISLVFTSVRSLDGAAQAPEVIKRLGDRWLAIKNAAGVKANRQRETQSALYS